MQANINGTRQYLHKWLLPDAEEVDHRNHNGCDNRRSNIRACTRAQNIANTRPRRDGRSACKGVFWNAGKWSVILRHQGRTHYLGRYTSEQDAGAAYARMARQLNGSFAYGATDG